VGPAALAEAPPVQVDDEREGPVHGRRRERHVDVERDAVEALDAGRERAGAELHALLLDARNAAGGHGRDGGGLEARHEEERHAPEAREAERSHVLPSYPMAGRTGKDGPVAAGWRERSGPASDRPCPPRRSATSSSTTRSTGAGIRSSASWASRPTRR